MTIPYPRISPVLVRIGPFAIRWYGVMYVLGYLVGYRLIRDRVARGLIVLSPAELDALIGYLLVGMLVGARLTYALVYQPGHYRDDPGELLRIWHGGLSFHGALVGMTLATLLFGRIHHVPFLQLADTLALAGPPGLGFGRLGNFINGELYGRVTHVPWAMVFPTDPEHLPRHPSQLYEALAEGLVLFLLIRWLERRAVTRGSYRPGLLAAAFLVGYGVFRFLIEFTRQPDEQLGFVLGPFSMGQLLCTFMILAGVTLASFIHAGSSRGQLTESGGPC